MTWPIALVACVAILAAAAVFVAERVHQVRRMLAFDVDRLDREHAKLRREWADFKLAHRMDE